MLKWDGKPVATPLKSAAGQLLCRVLKELGIRGLHKRRAIRKMTDASDKASRLLWINRGDLWTIQAT